MGWGAVGWADERTRDLGGNVAVAVWLVGLGGGVLTPHLSCAGVLRPHHILFRFALFLGGGGGVIH